MNIDLYGNFGTNNEHYLVKSTGRILVQQDGDAQLRTPSSAYPDNTSWLIHLDLDPRALHWQPAEYL